MTEHVEELRDALDKVLFLYFRDRCSFLESAGPPEIPIERHLCEHPENKAMGRFKEQGEGKPTNTGGLPNCFLGACPIYRNFEKEDNVPTQMAAFFARWVMEKMRAP